MKEQFNIDKEHKIKRFLIPYKRLSLIALILMFSPFIIMAILKLFKIEQYDNKTLFVAIIIFEGLSIIITFVKMLIPWKCPVCGHKMRAKHQGHKTTVFICDYCGLTIDTGERDNGLD